MPAYNLSVDDVLERLRQNPSFTQLPQDWQVKLAGQVHDVGLQPAMQMNANWLGEQRGNTADPVAGLVGSWLSQAGQSQTALTAPAALSDDDLLKWAASAGDPGSNPDYFKRLTALADSGNEQAKSILTAAGYENAQVDNPVPVEQDLLDKILHGYVYPGMDQDAANKVANQAILDKVNASIDQGITTNSSALDGTRLKAENTQADLTGTSMAGSANTEADALRTGLAALDTQRRAALDPVLAARLSAAEADATGVNQSLQSQRDALTAQQAQQGFYGGSTFDDAAQTRASIAAAQNAAQVLGQAKVLNATDLRGIGDDTAKTGYDITGRQASGVRDATDFATKLKQGYFDNDYTRQLIAARSNIDLNNQRFNALATSQANQNAGANGALQLLNWFTSNGAPPTSTPYYQTPYYQQPNQSGSDLAGLGAGLTGAAISIGNANKWWQTPSNPGAGASTSYSNFLANNPTSWAATGQPTY